MFIIWSVFISAHVALPCIHFSPDQFNWRGSRFGIAIISIVPNVLPVVEWTRKNVPIIGFSFFDSCWFSARTSGKDNCILYFFCVSESFRLHSSTLQTSWCVLKSAVTMIFCHMLSDNPILAWPHKCLNNNLFAVLLQLNYSLMSSNAE